MAPLETGRTEKAPVLSRTSQLEDQRLSSEDEDHAIRGPGDEDAVLFVELGRLDSFGSQPALAVAAVDMVVGDVVGNDSPDVVQIAGGASVKKLQSRTGEPTEFVTPTHTYFHPRDRRLSVTRRRPLLFHYSNLAMPAIW